MNDNETETLGDVIGYAMREDAPILEELKEHFVSEPTVLSVLQEQK